MPGDHLGVLRHAAATAPTCPPFGLLSVRSTEAAVTLARTLAAGEAKIIGSRGRNRASCGSAHRGGNHPIGMMSGATQRVTLVRMFKDGDHSDLRSQHLRDWREASKRVLRTYKTWCAAGRHDRHEEYLSLIRAPGREERAARQVERDSRSRLGANPQPVE
jgi:hypothetical protein